MNNILEKIKINNKEKGEKRKIENIVFLIIILIATVIVMNKILNENQNEEINEENTINSKTLADTEISNISTDEEEKIAEILKTIKGVGEAKIYISYLESSSLVPLYDETTTTSTTEEDDSDGGKRNVISTETNKEIVFSEQSGEKNPITQKTTNPVIKGAIITARGASNATVKSDIINAVEAVTGLSAEKIQVFEMN